MSVAGTIKKAKQKVADTMSGEAQDGDILDTLKKEHREVEALLNTLVESESATERKSLLKKIKGALVPHVRAEEKVVYDAIIALKEEDAKTDGEEGYLEHGLADEMLKKLGKMRNALSPEFNAGAKVLKELVQHHVEEEESNVWSDVRENFSDEDRVAMNKKFLAAKKKVKVPA